MMSSYRAAAIAALSLGAGLAGAPASQAAVVYNFERLAIPDAQVGAMSFQYTSADVILTDRFVDVADLDFCDVDPSEGVCTGVMFIVDTTGFTSTDAYDGINVVTDWGASGFYFDNGAIGAPGVHLGSFSAGQRLTVTVSPDTTSPTPEPATWALMLSGFGAVGAALRRRRLAVVVQPARYRIATSQRS